LWLIGALAATAFTLVRAPVAVLVGMGAAGIATGIWYWKTTGE